MYVCITSSQSKKETKKQSIKQIICKNFKSQNNSYIIKGVKVTPEIEYFRVNK